MNKENIHKNIKRVDHDYKVDDKVMLYNNYDFKYEVTHKGQFDINQCWTNVTITLECGEIQIRYNILHIKQYSYDTNIEYIINVEKYAWRYLHMIYQ